MNKKILLIGLLLVGYLFVFIFANNQHENVHQQIFVYHGCEKVEKRFAETECLKWEDNLSQIYKDKARELNSLNEIYGYNNQSLFFALLISTLSIVITLLVLHEKR